MWMRMRTDRRGQTGRSGDRVDKGKRKKEVEKSTDLEFHTIIICCIVSIPSVQQLGYTHTHSHANTHTHTAEKSLGHA